MFTRCNVYQFSWNKTQVTNPLSSASPSPPTAASLPRDLRTDVSLFGTLHMAIFWLSCLITPGTLRVETENGYSIIQSWLKFWGFVL